MATKIIPRQDMSSQLFLLLENCRLECQPRYLRSVLLISSLELSAEWAGNSRLEKCGVRFYFTQAWVVLVEVAHVSHRSECLSTVSRLSDDMALKYTVLVMEKLTNVIVFVFLGYR